MKQKVKLASLGEVELAAITDMNLIEKGLKVGQRIQVKWDDGHWYSAKVLKVKSPTVYAIQYDVDKVKEDIDLEADVIKTANAFTPDARHEKDHVINKTGKPTDAEGWKDWLSNVIDHSKTSRVTNAKFAEHVFNQLTVWKAASKADIDAAKKLVFELYAAYAELNKGKTKARQDVVNKGFRTTVSKVAALARSAGFNQPTALMLANRMVSNPSFAVS